MSKHDKVYNLFGEGNNFIKYLGASNHSVINTAAKNFKHDSIANYCQYDYMHVILTWSICCCLGRAFDIQSMISSLLIKASWSVISISLLNTSSTLQDLLHVEFFPVVKCLVLAEEPVCDFVPCQVR